MDINTSGVGRFENTVGYYIYLFIFSDNIEHRITVNAFSAEDFSHAL